MLRSVAALAALAALLGAGATSALPVPNVRGVLIQGPRNVFCPPDEPCDPPQTGFSLEFTRGTRVVTRARVAPGGAFATHLLPGRYGIRLVPPAMGGHVVPATVLVTRGTIVNLRLRIVPVPTA